MKKINLFVKPNEKSARVYEKLIKYSADRNIYLSHIFNDNANCNLVIGGDGSFLRAVHHSNFSSLPFIGINTGHLGFFQELNESDFEKGLDLFYSGNYKVQKLGLLEADIYTSAWTYRLKAVNEFVIRSNDHKMIHLRIGVDDIPFINTSGDGLIISTPAGSTAYNLSAHAAILYQTLKGYQIAALSPVHSKMYDSLPSSVVLPAESQTEIVSEIMDQERILLICDGVEHPFKDIKKISLKVPDLHISKVVFRPNWYWANLREKLF